MAEFKDIANESIFLKVQNGDIYFENSDQNHILDIVNANFGYFKEFPSVGVNAISYVNGQNIGGLQSSIVSQLNQDGYSNVSANVDSNGKMNINAKRN